MAYNILRAGRLVAIALAAYVAVGCSATTEDQNPLKTALASIEAPSPERLAEVHLRVGRAALDQGSLETALDLFEKAHESAPDTVEPLIGKGDVLFAQRDFDAAEGVYRAALVRDPASFEALEGLGKTLVTLKKFQEGLRAFEAARAIRTDAGLINKIGVTYELLGQGEAAQKHYREALILDAESLTARNNLALSLAVSGTYEIAVSEMEQVVSSPKSSERHHANLAFIYGLAGRPMDQAPAQVMRAAINKGWDEEFFARTRRLAKTGDRGAILDLLNNRAPRSANLPEMPEMPEDTADQPGTAQPAAAPLADIPPPPPAPVEPETAVDSQAAPKPVITALLPVSPDAPDLTASPPVADQPAINTVISPELVTEPEQTREPVLDAAPPPSPVDMAEPAAPVPPPPPAPTVMAETTAPMARPEPQIAMTEAAPVPAPPPAPADMAAPAATTAEPAPQLAMRTDDAVPAPPAAPQSTAPQADAAMPSAIYRLQLGAYPTSWLGRALHGLGKSAGDLLPGNRIEVVRGEKFHTLRSAGIAELTYARQLCKTLRARNVECFVTRQANPPAGQGFDIAAVGDQDALAQFIASIEPIAPVAAETRVAMLRQAGQTGARVAGLEGVTPSGSGKYRIQFAAYRRVEHLGRGLKVLRGKAGDLLPAIETLVRSESAEKTKIPYRLRSGPMDSRAAAVTLCQSLSEKGVECLVIRHGDQSWRLLG